MRSLIFCLAVACSLQLAVADEAKKDPVFSGPQAGEKLAALPIVNALAEDAKKVDVVAEANGKPTLLIFFHKRTRPAFGLSNAVMRFALTKKEKLASAVIVLTDDVTATETWIKGVRKNFPEGATYGVSPDGIEGPGAYGLNREVELTVIVAKGGNVTDNFALVQPSLQADGPKIVNAISKVLGEEAPDATKVLGVEQRGDTPVRPAVRPNPNNPAKPEPARGGGLAPELAELVRGVIQKDATPEQVDAAAKKVDELIKDRKDYQQQLGTVIKRLVDAKVFEKYGTERAREHLKAWGEKYKPTDDAPADAKPSATDKKPADAPAPSDKKDEKSDKS